MYASSILKFPCNVPIIYHFKNMMCLVFVESENAKICNVLQTYVKSQIVCILYVKSIFFLFPYCGASI